ncbi:hypothetical protein ACROYT_G006376 [Oculina patagonica]
MNITKASQQKAMLLHYVGEETCDVFETLTVPDPPEGSHEYKIAETQKSRENITEFYTRLQLLAGKCEFADTDLEVKRQIIQGTSSIRLSRKVIEQNLDLENLLKSARAMETADGQFSEMQRQESHWVGDNRSKTTDGLNKESSDRPPRSGSRNTKCGLCGGNYPHQ